MILTELRIHGQGVMHLSVWTGIMVSMESVDVCRQIKVELKLASRSKRRPNILRLHSHVRQSRRFKCDVFWVAMYNIRIQREEGGDGGR